MSVSPLCRVGWALYGALLLLGHDAGGEPNAKCLAAIEAIESAPEKHAFVPRQLVVGFAHEPCSADLDALLASLHARKVGACAACSALVVELSPAQEGPRISEIEALRSAATALCKRDDVRFVEPNFVTQLTTQDVPSEECKDVERDWWIEPIHAKQAWAFTTGSKRVVTAVVDTGLSTGLPEFQDSVWKNQREIAGNGLDDDGNGCVDDVHGCAFVDGLPANGDVTDRTGHGTGITAVIGAGWDSPNLHSLNQRITLLPSGLGKDNGVAEDMMCRAIEYAMSFRRGAPADVINLSFSWDYPSDCLREAFEEAGKRGVIAVAAAGDGGALLDAAKLYPCFYGLPNVLCVAAVTPSGSLWPRSNYSKTLVDVAAPGQCIATIDENGEPVIRGATSFAAPFVSGVVSLIRAQCENASPAEIRARIEHGTQVEALEDFVRGGNLLDAGKALAHDCGWTGDAPEPGVAPAR